MKNKEKTERQFVRELPAPINKIVNVQSKESKRKQPVEKTKNSRDLLNNIIESSLDAIVLTDNRGYVTNTNNSFLKLLGYTNAKQVIGKHMAECSPIEAGTYDSVTGKSVHIDEEFLERTIAVMSQLTKEGKIANLEFYLIRTDKKVVSVEENIVNLYNKAGERSGTVGIIRDITERKKYEEALKKSEEKYQSLIENANDAVISINREGVIVTLNKKVEEMYGYTREELLGKSVVLLVPSNRREGQKKALENFKTMPTVEGFRKTLETVACGKDGREFPVETSMFGSEIHGEYILTSFVRDITDRKKAEKELRETKDFLEKIIENSRDGILVVDGMGNILSCNTAIEQMSGFGKERIIGKHASTLIIDDKEIRQKILEKTAELFEKGFATYDAQYKSKDGKYLDVECTSSMISNEKGEYIAGVSIIRDISERKKAEQEIREGKEFLEKIIQGSKDGILISDGEGYILSSNEAIEEMLGLSKDEIVGKHSSELLLDDKSEREKVILKMGELFEQGFVSYETRYKSKNNDYVEVECYLSMIKDEKGGYIAGISIVRDITERKKMQQQLLQSEKLRSLGELAGGVAHDFNNVLAAILGRAQLLKMQFKSPPGKQEKRKSMLDLIKSLEIIERASSDGAETVRRIQEFSRKRSDDKDFTQVTINELLENVLEFTSVRWKNEAESKGIKITIQKEFSPLPATLGSAAELREVFTNIINNALDAMPHGGRIRIKTFKKENHIYISIKDTGVGIPEDIRNRIFDPFFTTKGVQSTGLGMSTSYGIINRHKGTISIDSTEGKGTTFTINIPIAEMKCEAEEKTKPILKEQRKATILVIEDEEEVRNLLADILIDSGHHVETASDGIQGIELFKEKDFDMVFTDIGMHGMSGWEVAESVKRITGKIPVAVITGWNVEMEKSEMRERGVHLIAHKPFEVNQILDLVQEGMELREQFEAA